MIGTDVNHYVPAVRIVPGREKPAVLTASARLFAHSALGEPSLVKVNDLLWPILGFEDEGRSAPPWSRSWICGDPGRKGIRICRPT